VNSGPCTLMGRHLVKMHGSPPNHMGVHMAGPKRTRPPIRVWLGPSHWAGQGRCGRMSVLCSCELALARQHAGDFGAAPPVPRLHHRPRVKAWHGVRVPSQPRILVSSCLLNADPDLTCIPAGSVRGWKPGRSDLDLCLQHTYTCAHEHTSTRPDLHLLDDRTCSRWSESNPRFYGLLLA
jgi:hypothetical protein